MRMRFLFCRLRRSVLFCKSVLVAVESRWHPQETTTPGIRWSSANLQVQQEHVQTAGSWIRKKQVRTILKKLCFLLLGNILGIRCYKKSRFCQAIHLIRLWDRDRFKFASWYETIQLLHIATLTTERRLTKSKCRVYCKTWKKFLLQ